MKLPTNELATIFREGEIRRNAIALLRYGVFLVGVVLLFSALFLLIMTQVEGQSHSLITALYWTLVTMSTLGVGDVVFVSNVGRLLTVLVLMSGTVLLLVVLPFTFIRFFYAPWLEAKVWLRAPRRLGAAVRDHVVIARYDAIAADLVERLRSDGVEYCVIEPDPVRAGQLSSEGVSVVTGDRDNRDTYEGVRIDQARLLLANCEDTTNTNITLTVRDVSPEVPILAVVEHEDSIDILELSGCTHVLPLKSRLGEYLADRVSAGLGSTDVVGSVKGLQIVEFSARQTPLAGLTVRETDLRTRTGLNIIGVWHRGRLKPAFPNTPIEDDTIVIVVGTSEQRYALNELIAQASHPDAPILIVGAGAVGSAAARALRRRGSRVHLLDRDPQTIECLKDVANEVFVGDANDRKNLERAGLKDAPSVLLTTNDDAMNVYLTVYCRGLKPDLRIVSRITHERNLEAIHRAGADFVLGYASLGAEAVVSLLEGHELVMLGEGVDLFSVKLPASLAGKTLAQTGIGSRTGLSVVALQDGSQLVTTLRSEMQLNAGTELVMLGNLAQRRAFTETFG